MRSIRNPGRVQLSLTPGSGSRRFWLVAAVVSVAMALALTANGHVPTRGASDSGLIAPAGVCVPGWTIQDSPNPDPTQNFLAAVSGTGDNDVWAVGGSGPPGSVKTLIEHRDGNSWMVVPSPNLGANSELNGVFAISPTNAWAVGASGQTNPQPLAMHWNGTNWILATIPSTGAPVAVLNAVSGSSANNVYAAGFKVSQQNPLNPKILAERSLDGGITWHTVEVADRDGIINGVIAPAPNNVWFAGSTGSFLNQTAAAWLLNGTVLTELPVPNAGSPSALTAITVDPLNPKVVYAAGWGGSPAQNLVYNFEFDPQGNLLFVHKEVVPNPSALGNSLFAIGGSAATRRFAVGRQDTPNHGFTVDILESDKGYDKWASQGFPNSGTASSLNGVFVGPHAAIAVGQRGNQTLVERTCILPPPTLKSITVLKLNSITNKPLAGWHMSLHAGSGCAGNAIATATTNAKGLVDFNGLTPGQYSVAETPQQGWTNDSPLCQNVDPAESAAASGSHAASPADVPPCPIQPDGAFPAPGCDSFNSGAQFNIKLAITPDQTHTVTLNGPTQIERKNAPADSNGNGKDDVPTEIVALTLTGTSDLGPITVTQSAARKSLGMFEENANVTAGMDFPAASFFDVFVEAQTTVGTLHNEVPVRLQCQIDQIPPLLCLYQPPLNEPIPLLDQNGVILAYIVHAAHLPLPPGEVLLTFLNRKSLVWGDGICAGAVTAVSALADLVFVAGLPPLTQHQPCPLIGSTLGNGAIWGDWRCDGIVDATDGLAGLVFVALLPPLTQQQPCPLIGDP